MTTRLQRERERERVPRESADPIHVDSKLTCITPNVSHNFKLAPQFYQPPYMQILKRSHHP